MVTKLVNSSTAPGHFLADLQAITKAKLNAAGVASERISSQGESTLTNERYHSARRDGESSGRMATVVGLHFDDRGARVIKAVQY